MLELEVRGQEVVARAGHLAFPSRVALDACRAQRAERVGQIAEALLKEQITTGARMRFRSDAAAADGQLERRTDRENEFMTRERDEHPFVGEAQVGESAGSGLLAFLFEALIAEEEREAGV